MVAVGHATLDLDQAVAQPNIGNAADEPLLGARCRIVYSTTGPWVLLLEPSTEGRLAASLARYGQVPVAEYLTIATHDETTVAAASAGIALSPPAVGPLGNERLVLGNRPWGPHLILLEEDPRGAPQPPAATIRR